jgi:hypothetical protein
VDESAKPTDQQGTSDADDEGFTLQELMHAYNSNFDHLGRRIDRPAEDK